MPPQRIDLIAPQPVLSLEPLSGELGADAWRGVLSAVEVPAHALPLLRTWQRSQEHGVDEDGTALLEDAVLDRRGFAEAAQRVEEVWRGAESVLDDFAALCASRDFVAVFADRDGVVTRSLGGGAFADEARRLRLIEGAVWGEDLRGTNAIGTALVEHTAVAVHGAAHFSRVNKGLCCFAAPVRDPRGNIVGVLDATSYADRARLFDPSVVVTVARAVEEVLRARAYAGSAGGVDLVERLMERAQDAAFLVERPGRVVRANARGRSLSATAVAASRPVLPTWDELEAQARMGHGPVVWSPDHDERHAVDVSIETLTDAQGGVLAFLVFLAAADAPALRSAVRRAPTAAGSLAKVEDSGPSAVAEPFRSVVGSDPALTLARESSLRLARSKLPILLLAETGSGKELFARAIHEASRRAEGPFVPVNCGGIARDLLLSELFGYGPGAFTGAARDGGEGRIAVADGGTLFLDEIAEMSADAQVALLRVLEDGSYVRVGETRQRRTDIRVVAATCRDLRGMVESGGFRRDLYFRISGACVELPPLRVRTDFEELLDALWSRVETPDGGPAGRLDAEVRELLREHPWPGNVRELKSTLEFLAVMSGGESEVRAAHLPPPFRAGAGAHADRSGPVVESEAPAVPVVSQPVDLRSLRREALEAALREEQGNVSAAARRLGVARSTVYRLAKRLGIDIG